MQKPFELFSGLNKTLTGMKGRSDEEGGGGGGREMEGVNFGLQQQLGNSFQSFSKLK